MSLPATVFIVGFGIGLAVALTAWELLYAASRNRLEDELNSEKANNLRLERKMRPMGPWGNGT